MEDKLKLIAQVIRAERIKFNESLAPFTYSNKKGIAECLYIATNRSELLKILNLSYELKIPYFILGGGTKILVPDDGIKGLVIKNRSSSIKIAGVKGKVGKSGVGVDEALIEADSGVSIGKFNDFLKIQGLEELSSFSHKNSTIGGALFVDHWLQRMVQKLDVWFSGFSSSISADELSLNQVIIAATFKVKAKLR